MPNLCNLDMRGDLADLLASNCMCLLRSIHNPKNCGSADVCPTSERSTGSVEADMFGGAVGLLEDELLNLWKHDVMSDWVGPLLDGELSLLRPFSRRAGVVGIQWSAPKKKNAVELCAGAFDLDDFDVLGVLVGLFENDVLNLWSLHMFGHLADLLVDSGFCLRTHLLCRHAW